MKPSVFPRGALTSTISIRSAGWLLTSGGALCLALVAAGCRGGTGGDATLSDMRGIELTPPIPKPDFRLTDTEGRPFHFRERTDGHVTLLFFGYTHCPDICPLHMANIAAVLRRMPYEQRERFKVVFVTTDPDRDTPGRLREWLDGFDASFIGLTGTREEIEVAERTFSMRPAVIEPSTDGSGDYGVSHAAQVIAFTRDDEARFLYPFGIRQQDWANDLPRLAGAAAEGS